MVYYIIIRTSFVEGWLYLFALFDISLNSCLKLARGRIQEQPYTLQIARPFRPGRSPVTQPPQTPGQTQTGLTQDPRRDTKTKERL